MKVLTYLMLATFFAWGLVPAAFAGPTTLSDTEMEEIIAGTIVDQFDPDVIDASHDGYLLLQANAQGQLRAVNNSIAVNSQNNTQSNIRAFGASSGNQTNVGVNVATGNAF